MTERKKKRPRPTAKSLANLRPSKPGEVRNPEGKNGSEWRKSFREYFAELDVDLADPRAKEELDGRAKPGTADRTPRVRNIWRALYRSALSGHVGDRQFIIEHMQGLAIQGVEVAGPDGSAINAGPQVVLKMPDNGKGPATDDDDDVGDEPPAPDDESPPSDDN